jgi:hypothetical protein
MTWTLSWFEDVIVGYGQPPEGLPATRVAILEQEMATSQRRMGINRYWFHSDFWMTFNRLPGMTPAFWLRMQACNRHSHSHRHRPRPLFDSAAHL